MESGDTIWKFLLLLRFVIEHNPLYRMVSHPDKWIRIYDIPETSQHKKGFTIYKVISMVNILWRTILYVVRVSYMEYFQLYPERCPDAVTKITVWKRYNEFKRLHRELKSKHRSLRLSDKFPVLPNHPFFKRYFITYN